MKSLPREIPLPQDWAISTAVHFGSVTFNLAENPGDERAPFAFLATVETTIAEGATTRKCHVPLGSVVFDPHVPDWKAQSLLALVTQVASHDDVVRKLAK